MDPAPVELVPPPDPRFVLRVGLVGLGLSAAAAVLGAVAPADPESVLHTGRLVLVAAGVLTAGCAVALRPGLWKVWLLAAGTGLLAAVLGLPEHWDSARLLARALTGLSAAGAGLAALTPVARYSVVSVAVVFHFGGILTATTGPEPTPWPTQQIGTRVYLPYLMFMYLRNAYHFYSPEPGPASDLFVLVKYELDEIDPETGAKKVKHAWETFPRRDQHMKDPLGLTYYRRLSLTEMVAPSFPDTAFAPSVRQDAQARRVNNAYGLAKEPIPLSDEVPLAAQFRIPRPDISRYVLPSYAEHICADYTASRQTKVASVKVYRAEHRLVGPKEFADGSSPFDPRTFWIYYLGDYDPDGKLIDPQDPMLYWLVPLPTKPGGPSPTDPKRLPYEDYLQKHSGHEFPWERMRQ